MISDTAVVSSSALHLLPVHSASCIWRQQCRNHSAAALLVRLFLCYSSTVVGLVLLSASSLSCVWGQVHCLLPSWFACCTLILVCLPKVNHLQSCFPHLTAQDFYLWVHGYDLKLDIFKFCFKQPNQVRRVKHALTAYECNYLFLCLYTSPSPLIQENVSEHHITCLSHLEQDHRWCENEWHIACTPVLTS